MANIRDMKNRGFKDSKIYVRVVLVSKLFKAEHTIEFLG